jgi:hypothetical protein
MLTPGTRVRFIGTNHDIHSVGDVGTVVPAADDIDPGMRVVLFDDLARDAIDRGDGMPEVVCHLVRAEDLQALVPLAPDHQSMRISADGTPAPLAHVHPADRDRR